MLKKISVNFLSQIWSLSISLADRVILIAILLRVCGAETYADWATLFAMASLISIGELGLNIYFGNQWQRAYAQKNEIEFQRFIGISLWIYAVLGTGLALLVTGMVLFGNVALHFNFHTLNVSASITIFLLLSGAQILRVMRGSISQIYRGRGQFASGTMVDSVAFGGVVFFVGVAALMGASPTIIAIIYLINDLVLGWGVMMFDLRRRFKSLRFLPIRPTAYEVKHIVSHGKWYALLQGAPIAWLQVPVLIISAVGFAGASLVGFLLARTLVNFTRQITEMLARSVGVETASAFHLEKKEELASTLSAFGRFLSGLNGGILGGIMVFGSTIIALWSGKPDLYNVWVFFWLLVPSVFIAPALPIKNVLMLGNLPRPVGLASILQILIGLPLSYGLAHYYGTAGVAAALAIGEVIALGIFLPSISFHHIGDRYLKYFSQCVTVFSLTWSWCALVAWLVLHIFDVNSFLMFVMAGTLWGLFGFLPTLLISTPKDKRLQIFSNIKKIGLFRMRG
jgi:O-antigen/teichoic acid export membrane protein